MNQELLHALLAKSAVLHGVPGAQLAVRAEGLTTEAVVGEQAHGSDVPVTADSAFPLGSLTKPFTAVLALVLVADGDVALDAPLGRYLPHPVPPITLRQVLSHTAGLASGVAEASTGIVDRGRWVRAHCGPDVLVHSPGTVFSYSNVGYLLAGYLVEAVTGMGWAEAVRTILLEPLGITPSFVVGRPTGRAALVGHSVRSNGRVVPLREQDLPEVEAPGGALALSAVDLVAFTRAHLSGGGPLEALLDEVLADQTTGMTTGPFGLADGWGLGWSVYHRSGRVWHGHDGSGSGTSCHLRFDAESGTVVAFTANAGSGLTMWADVVGELRANGVDVGSHSYSALTERGAPIPAAPGCEGRFTNGDTEFTIGTGPNGRLLMAIDDIPYAELSLVEDLRFTLRELDGGMVHTGRFLVASGTSAAHGVQLVGRLAKRSG